MIVKPKPRRNLPARNMYKGKVLQILKGSPLPFNEIGRRARIWPAMLTNILVDLVEDEKLEQVPHERRLAYKITKKGIKSIVDLGILGVEATEIMQKGGIYHDDYSNQYGEMTYHWKLAWGIQDDIVYDKSLQKINPISQNTAHAVNKFLYHCIKEDVKNKKVILDGTKNGKIILGLTIDYQDLVKSISEQSMYYLENMSKEEHKFFDKIGDRTLNSSEQAKLDDIRKQARAKIGVKIK